MVASASTWAVNEGIYIAGAGAAGANYVGTVTGLSGSTFTISPATSTTVPNGTLVQHDDTAAFQAAINALTTGGNIVVPNGYYRMNAPQTTVNGLSAVLQIPQVTQNGSLNSNPFITIQIQGQEDPTVNLTNTLQGGVVLETDENTGNFIGGAGASSTFTGVYLSLKNLVIRTPQNPAITAINANLVGGLHLENVIVDVLGEGALYNSVPNNANGIGVIAPAPGSGNLSLFQNLKVFGQYVGVQLFDHAYLDYVAFGYDNIAIELGNSVSNGAHGVGGNYVDVEQCPYGIVPIPSVGGWFNITNYDFEHDPGTFASVADLYDPNNLLSGALSYGGLGGISGSNKNLNVTGGANVQLTSLVPSALNARLGGATWTAGAYIEGPAGLSPAIVPTQTGQVLTITLPPGFTTSGSGADNGYVSLTLSNFTGHTFSARMQPNIVGVGVVEEFPFIFMGLSSTQNVSIYPYNDGVHGDLLYAVKEDGGLSVVSSESYNPATYPFVRIREASGTLYFDTSPDGVTWTNTLGSTTVSWSYTSGVILNLGAAIVASHTTPSNPGYVQFDQVAVQ